MLTPADVDALREKYSRMLRLRELHDRKKIDPSFQEPDPRPEMIRLAEEFPGSLREIDVLPLDVIRDRIEALSRPPPWERWMEAQSMFHRLARGALRTKRWLGKRKEITTELRAELARSSVAGAVDESDLESIANPPNGRLMNVVHAMVARRVGVSAAEAKRLVFGDPHRQDT